jgi:copper(I)-binding protein
MKIIATFLFILLVQFANAANIQSGLSKLSPPSGPLLISDSWTNATKGDEPTILVYMIIENKRVDSDYLLSAETEIADKVELRSILKEEDLFGSKEKPIIEIPPQSQVSVQPGTNYEIKLIGLKQPLPVMRKFVISLKFERAGTVKAEVSVRKAN